MKGKGKEHEPFDAATDFLRSTITPPTPTAPRPSPPSSRPRLQPDRFPAKKETEALRPGLGRFDDGGSSKEVVGGGACDEFDIDGGAVGEPVGSL